MGDMGRSGKAAQGAGAIEDGEKFDKLLDREIDEEKPEVESPQVEQELKDSQIENRKDADRLSREGGEGEAEKAAGQWRGPQPHPSMGLAMLSVPQQLQAQMLENMGKTQKQRDAGEGKSVGEGPELVPSSLIQALRQSGLQQPITGFQDPRIKGGPPRLGLEWKQQDFPGGKICRWEGSQGARQVLRWSEKESLLETSAAGQRQVIQKRGDQVWSETTDWDEERGFELPRPI
jgi:hypothetical protein